MHTSSFIGTKMLNLILPLLRWKAVYTYVLYWVGRILCMYPSLGMTYFTHLSLLGCEAFYIPIHHQDGWDYNHIPPGEWYNWNITTPQEWLYCNVISSQVSKHLQSVNPPNQCCEGVQNLPCITCESVKNLPSSLWLHPWEWMRDSPHIPLWCIENSQNLPLVG